MNSTIFTAHCQAWLDDLTRLQVTHGLCQPEIKKWHRLTVTSCSLPNGLTGLLIIPQFLLTVTQAACVEEESVAGRIIKRAEGPALAGMLRSECYRLGLSWAWYCLFPQSKPLSIPGKDDGGLRFGLFRITEKMILKKVSE